MKLERVTKSSMASEAMALAKSLDAGHFLALITKRDLWVENSSKTVLQNRWQITGRTFQELKVNIRPLAQDGYCKASKDGDKRCKMQ